MWRQLLTAIVTLLLAGPAAPQAPPPAPDAEELTRLLKYFLDGASRDDIAVHERFWADDLIYTRSAGVRIGKADILADLRAAPPAEPSPPTAYTAEDIRIQQYGDMAVVAFRLVGTTGSGAGAEVDHYLNTGTFLKRHGEWRAVAWQATRVPAKEAEVNLTPGPTARAGLHDEILAADAALFKAFFDTCDIDALRGLVTDDFEMFHDKGGRGPTSGAAFVQAAQDKCKRQADGIDFMSTRKLVPESMKVYPINNYGAVETGVHTFYAVKQGEPDRLTETSQFVHVWKEDNGHWRLARVLSFDHQLAP